MTKRYGIEQGSLDWYTARLGTPTASNFHKLITPGGKESTQARNYLYRLVAERLLRESMDDQIGQVQWIERGTALQPDAAAHFQFTTDQELLPGGFYTTDDGRLGASPDGVIKGKNQGVEIKCPAAWTQIGYLLDGPGANYRPQVQGQLLVTEFEAVHFYAWHPQTPPFHILTAADPVFQRTLRDILGAFLFELDKATELARSIGAYAVVSRTVTPADDAFGEPGDAPLQIVVPGHEAD